MPIRHVMPVRLLAAAVAAVLMPLVAVAQPPSGQGACVPGRAGAIEHMVQAGETWRDICQQYQLSATMCQQLAACHQPLRAGQPVRIALDGLPFQPQPVRLRQTVGDVQVNGQPASAGARLEENSHIETGAHSSALLEMADGSRVILMPRSVADVVRNRQYQTGRGARMMEWFAGKMRLTQGALEALVEKVAPGAQPLEVETSTSLIGVRGTHFRVAAADEYVRADRAEVLSGEVDNANTWKHSSIRLHAGQGAVVNPNVADMQAVTLLPAPAVPEQPQQMRLPQSVWTFPAVAGAQYYRVMAARDAQFENISYSELVSSTAADLSHLGTGTWHMRVRGVDGHGLEGHDGQAVLHIRLPAWGLAHMAVQPQLYGSPVLVWGALHFANGQTVPGASTLQVSLSRQPDFAGAQQWQVDAAAGELPLAGVTQGTYYLRLAASNPALEKDDSQIYRFTLPAGWRYGSPSVLLETVR